MRDSGIPGNPAPVVTFRDGSSINMITGIPADDTMTTVEVESHELHEPSDDENQENSVPSETPLSRLNESTQDDIQDEPKKRTRRTKAQIAEDEKNDEKSDEKDGDKS